MNFEEVITGTQTIFEGRVVKLYLDTVTLPDGNEAIREVIRHKGAVGVIPLHEDGQVTLVRQYRLPTGQALWEIPAGGLEPGETPAECAARELQEEVDLKPGRLMEFGGFYPVPAYSSEYIHLFIALDMEPSSLPGDVDEFMEVMTLPLQDALAMIDSAEIVEAKTIAALLRVERWLVSQDQD